MDFEFGVTATVNRPGGADQFGNPLSGTTHTVDGCAPAPPGTIRSFVEAHGTEATVEWDLILLAPYEADFRAQDVVTLPDDLDADGEPTRYQVHGRPEKFRAPFTGWSAGMMVILKSVEG